MLSQIAKQLTS